MRSMEKQRRRCKKLNRMVWAICERKEVLDGNSKFPAKIIYLPIDCCNKKCEQYRWCKLSEFDNIE